MKQVLPFLLLFVFPLLLFSQQADTALINKDTVLKTAPVYDHDWQKIIGENSFLNTKGRPVNMVNQVRKPFPQSIIFYLLLLVIAALSFFRFFYTRYFNNLFRVFFNTSLRQSQLTDQLLQAKLPSLFFNIFFTLTGGIYIYFLLRYFNRLTGDTPLPLIISCTTIAAIIYFIKYIGLKFTGWLTGLKEATGTYIFVVFLINKILGILLIPFIVVIAFSSPALVKPAIMASLVMVALMFLLRFFRSYELLREQLRMTGFHFLIYLVAVEITPLLLIYKALMLYIR